MDPWEAQKKEPKAPDKNIEALNNKDSNIIMKIKPDTPYTNCAKQHNYSQRVLSSNKESSVSSLNEPDLKALLEEAMAYKRPKDIQGKSDLFKELLQSVESEKKYSGISRSEKQSSRKPRRKQVNRKEVEKIGMTGDYQDVIVQVNDCDDSTKRQVKYSLKCSPNTEVVPINPISICDENNPEVAALLENGSFESLEQIQQFIAAEANVYQIQPKEAVDNRVTFPLATSQASEKSSEEIKYPDTPRISVKDIATLTGQPRESTDLSLVSQDRPSDVKKSLDENGNAVGTSRMDSLAERKAKARRLKAKNDKNIILSQHIEGHRSDIAEDIDALIKYIESPKITEAKPGRQRNNNSNYSSKHGSRSNNKMASSRDKSSDTFSRKSQKTKEEKLQKCSSLEEVSISKFEDLTEAKVSDERIKSTSKKTSNDKSNSKSDNSQIEKEVYSVGGVSTARNDKCEQESFDADFLPVTKKSRKKKTVYENSLRNRTNKANDHYRNEKMLSSCYMGKSQDLEGFRPPTREFQRRKSISSVPSSDKSGDTSDMDSVHSFPVSSSKGKGMKGNVSVSSGSGSTPQISYADIARSVPSPTRNELSPKCKGNIDNYAEFEESLQYSPLEPIPTVIFQLPLRKEQMESCNKSHEEYPPLFHKTLGKHSSSNDMFVEYTVVVPKRNSSPERNSVDVEETVLIEMPTTNRDIPAMDSLNFNLDNNLVSRRPPVILMVNNNNNNSTNNINSHAIENNDLNDLVFGFEVNEQLLSNSDRFKKCDLVSNISNEDHNSDKNISVDQVPSDLKKSSTLCEFDAKKTHIEVPVEYELTIAQRMHLMDIAYYVTSEWEAVQEEFKSVPGRVVYFKP